MLNTFNERFSYNQRVSLIFAASAVVAVGLALLFGVSVGEMAGVLLAYLAGGLIVMAFVHSWRDSRRFLKFGILAVLGFFAGVFLHNMFYALAELTASTPIVSGIFGVLEVIFFLLAVIVAPPAAAIGFVAAIVTRFTAPEKPGF